MPIRDFECSNCHKPQERVYFTTSELPFCECGGSLFMLARSDEGMRRFRGAAFPFTTPHISGAPMVIESMGQLRQVERQYGVVLSAFSQNPSNLDPIKDPPRFRGHDADFRRR